MSIIDKIYQHKKSSVYALFLLSYISILLLTLSSNIIYYAQINKQITAKTEVSRQLLLTQLQTTVEAGTSEIEDLCNEIAFDKNIYQYAKSFSTLSAKDIKNVLSSKLYRGNAVYDYFIYIKETDEIITPTIKMSARQFYDIIYTLEDLSYEDFRTQYLDATHFRHYMPIKNIVAYEDNTVQILPFIQTFPVGNSQKPLGQVICFIDAQKLFANIPLIHQSTGSDVYVLNDANELITASQDAPEPDISSIDTIASGRSTRDAVISKQLADSTGWKFIIQTPRQLSLMENRRFLLTTLAIFFAYLVAGLFLVRFLTAKSYRPISEINALINRNLTGALPLNGINEFDAIKGTIIHQIQQDKKLTGIINNQIPYVRRAVFEHILKGLITDYEQAGDRLKDLDVVFTSKFFLTVVLEVEESSPFLLSSGTPDENLYLARLITSNVGNELFEEEFTCYCLDYGLQQCVFLLNPLHAHSKEELAGLAARQTASLLLFVKEKCKLYCYAGISHVHTKLNSLPLCYDEGRKAAEYGRMVQTQTPVSFDSLQNLESNYYYPAELEYQLISSLKSGHFDQAKALVENIFMMNTRSKSLSAQALRGLLFELHTTLSKQVNSIYIAKGEEPVTAYSYDELFKSPSIDTARIQFFDMIDQIAYQKMNDKGGGRTEKLAEAIAGYILENAADQWIDLNTLSEKFQVTPQYISNIFKRYHNENIKDYISKAKLDKAKELLLTTGLSVNEIAQQLGYAGEIGIIRLFKKYEGMTPGDFRNTKK